MTESTVNQRIADTLLEMYYRGKDGKGLSEAELSRTTAQLSKLLIEAQNKAYETALYDIESVVTLQGPKIKATDAMRLIYDRLTASKEEQEKFHE